MTALFQKGIWFLFDTVMFEEKSNIDLAFLLKPAALPC